MSMGNDRRGDREGRSRDRHVSIQRRIFKLFPPSRVPKRVLILFFVMCCRPLMTCADAAVTSYLKSWGNKYSSYFNREGRGFPDVAAQGRFSMPLCVELFFSSSTPTTTHISKLMHPWKINRQSDPILRCGGILTDIRNIRVGTNGRFPHCIIERSSVTLWHA